MMRSFFSFVNFLFLAKGMVYMCVGSVAMSSKALAT